MSTSNSEDINMSSFAVIPSYILDDDDLDEGAKNLYARISMYSKEGRCWASNNHFSEKHKVTERCIQKWLKQLVDKGYLVVEIDSTGFQTKRNIWLTNDFKKFSTKRTTVRPPPNCSSPPPESQFGSTYRINKIEDKYKQQQHAGASDVVVVVPAAPEKFSCDLEITKDDVHCKALSQGWTSEEVDHAWSVFISNRTSVNSPWDYIEGVILKSRTIKQAKQSKQKVKSCQQNEITQEKQKNCEQKSSMNDIGPNLLAAFADHLLRPKQKLCNS